MKKDFITIGDQQYRVELNMSTTERWQQLTGRDISEFEEASVKAAQAGKGVGSFEIFAWLFVSIIEGQELEGTKFTLSFDEFKKICRPATLARFSPIFIRHYMDNTAVEEVKKKSRIRRLIAAKRKNLHTVLPTKTQRLWFYTISTGMSVGLIYVVLRSFGALCGNIVVASTIDMLTRIT